MWEENPDFSQVIGKKLVSVKYDRGCCCCTLIFEDGTRMDIDGEECFDFHVGFSRKNHNSNMESNDDE